MDLIMEDMKARLQADPVNRARLKAALEKVSMGGIGYVSMTDSISLRNWLCEVYELPVSTFDTVPILQLKAMGEAMLAEGPGELR